MELNGSQIIINDGITVNWNTVRTLKVLNNKLFFALNGGLTVEVTGLAPKSVDEVFLAYYKYLNPS